jgi:hypothetical protein
MSHKYQPSHKTKLEIGLEGYATGKSGVEYTVHLLWELCSLLQFIPSVHVLKAMRRRRGSRAAVMMEV